nr:ATP-binding domain-containing protein [Ardenticatenales bacterium]
AALPEEARGAELIQQLVLERIPEVFGVASDEVQVIAPRYQGAMGVDELNGRLRAGLNPVRANRSEVVFGNRQFRVGDRVMSIRNDQEKEVVNGLQGRITDAEPGSKAVTVLFDGEISATFRGEQLDNLTHAYAITAHKSQGGEFPVVLLAMDQSAGRLLYRQLLYTAITRARHLLILVGDPSALDRATANDRPRHRWTGLAWWLQHGFG